MIDKKTILDKRTIAVVDDSTTNLKFAEKALMADYKVVLLTSGKQLLRYLKKNRPDLILLDINMPEMDGYQTIQEVKALPQATHIPVIFLTASSDMDSEIRGLELGAVDFIVKPFAPRSMLTRICNHLELADYRHNLEGMVREKTRQIELVQDALVISLTDLVECRDGQTGGHSRRVAFYTELLLDALYRKHKFPDIINKNYIRQIKRGAVLHDIGKVGIADMALLKESRLSDQEMEYMRQHTTFGGAALEHAIEKIGTTTFLNHARDLALYHHEKWNGKGYPKGLAGTEIPLSARILSIADVYDALTSKRSYKEPFSHEKAVSIILNDSGTAFDPDIIEVFQEIENKFRRALEVFQQ